MTRLIAILVALMFALGTVAVPTVHAAGTTTKPPAKSDSPEAKGGAGKPMKKQLDINSASEDDLKTLPGVTDEIAKKIVAGRPYTGKDQLFKQNIVDKDEYAKIRNLIHAKQPKAIGGQGAPEQHTAPGPATGAAPAPKK